MKVKLSSAYLCERLCRQYEIRDGCATSGRDGYLRPFFQEGAGTPFLGKTALTDDRKRGHVCVVDLTKETDSEKAAAWAARLEILPVFCVRAGQKAAAAGPEAAIWLTLAPQEGAFSVLNTIQQIFDDCDAWDLQVTQKLTEKGGIGKIVDLTARFLGNPLSVIGLDFSLVAEAGADCLPQRARLFGESGVNMDYLNALVQDAAYQNLAQTRETTLFPAYISGCRSLNRNLYPEGQPTHRLILTECQKPLSEGDICILEALAGRLEFLLAQEGAVSGAGDLEPVFQRILSDRTADYIQISRQLSSLGWCESHEYLCLILQITYLNQKQLSTKAICHYLKRQLPDSVSFFYQEEIVTFFNLTRLKAGEEEVAAKLVYFIRDSYLKAGYSRTMQGHMNLRRQYVQARTALDVGSRKNPYLWIHHFSQVALTYLMEQATRRLPGSMLCHEGLLKLRQQDEKNHTEYVLTLKTYLNCHLGATQAAKQLFIHRSTFLYRLEKIKEFLASDLEDPDELFYLELSLRLLEQEEERGL